MCNYIEKIKQRIKDHDRTLELRVKSIKKLDDCWQLEVWVYSIGMCTDEYEGEGFVYLTNIEKFDPVKSINDFLPE